LIAERQIGNEPGNPETAKQFAGRGNSGSLAAFLNIFNSGCRENNSIARALGFFPDSLNAAQIYIKERLWMTSAVQRRKSKKQSRTSPEESS
jgi:hypothetical protein